MGLDCIYNLVQCCLQSCLIDNMLILFSNAKCHFSIIDEAIDNNFVTDLTSMFLEDSKEFVGSPGQLPPVQIPQFSSTFGAISNTGARTLADGKDVSAVIDSVEFCVNPKLFVMATGVVKTPYDSVVSIEYNLGDDMDDDDRENFYSKLIGQRYV